MSSRLDGDVRGRGIADAVQLIPGANELIAAFSESCWVAEEPEAHLRPHVEEWCQRDGRLALKDANTDECNAYVLELEWCGEGSLGRRGPPSFR
jgi:hypothetical protein